MKKQIMSIAAAAALFTTGAMAFDTVNGSLKVNNKVEPKGTIVTELSGKLYKSSYKTSTAEGVEDLKKSISYKGDALIYPAFNQKTGWGTEIVVRNTSDKAIVAKAVIYSGVDSEEVLDFNIYLSAKDVCRFTIKDGKVTSSDNSIRSWGINPHQASRVDRINNPGKDRSDFALIEFADKTSHPFEFSVPVNTGYVAIYGMEQSTNFDGFHKKHAHLYAAYAQSLSDGRGGEAWRTVSDDTAGAMKHGMFIDGKGGPTISPNIAAVGSVTYQQFSSTTKKYINRTVEFTSVDPVLTGQVRIYTEGRDLLLNATALENFTSDGVSILWTEGEYASMADRRIDVDALYNLTDITTDSNIFKINSAVYTYANAAGGTTENKILLTQPYKRTISQLGAATVEGYTGNADHIHNKKVTTGSKYKFSMDLHIWDESENANEEALAGTAIVSPRTTGSDSVTFNRELQEVTSAQLEELAPEVSKDKNGFVDISNFTIPAIVTQMSASKAGSSDEINWVYADTVPQP